MKTSGNPDDLPLLFESSEYRRSLTHAENASRIASCKDSFFDVPELGGQGRAGIGLLRSAALLGVLAGSDKSLSSQQSDNRL